jgi:hypothetical protein
MHRYRPEQPAFPLFGVERLCMPMKSLRRSSPPLPPPLPTPFWPPSLITHPCSQAVRILRTVCWGAGSVHDDISMLCVVDPLLAVARARLACPTVVEDVLACVYNLTLGANVAPLLQVRASLSGGGGEDEIVLSPLHACACAASRVLCVKGGCCLPCTQVFSLLWSVSV